MKGTRVFDGKRYYAVRAEGTPSKIKSVVQKLATKVRKAGALARTVKIGNEYWLFWRLA